MTFDPAVLTGQKVSGGVLIDELHALGLGRPIVVTELGFPTGQGATRDAAALRRDLRASLDLVRANSASGLILWPFQTDYAELPGDLFAR